MTQVLTMRIKLGFVAGLLVTLAMPAVAEVYRHVDKDGNVTFSDEPSEGAEEVRVKPVTTVTLPKLKDVQTPPRRTADEGERAPYENITFVAPNNDEAFHSGSGDVAFQVTSTPPLRNGHKYEVALDGQPVGQSTSGTVMVRNVFRGTHDAAVHVVDRNGARIQTGESISFTIHRPSVNN